MPFSLDQPWLEFVFWIAVGSTMLLLFVIAFFLSPRSVRSAAELVQALAALVAIVWAIFALLEQSVTGSDTWRWIAGLCALAMVLCGWRLIQYRYR